jgi:hypothetical protein
MQPETHTTRRHADAPEEQGQPTVTRKVKVEHGQQGDGNAEAFPPAQLRSQRQSPPPAKPTVP